MSWHRAHTEKIVTLGQKFQNKSWCFIIYVDLELWRIWCPLIRHNAFLFWFEYSIATFYRLVWNQECRFSRILNLGPLRQCYFFTTLPFLKMCPFSGLCPFPGKCPYFWLWPFSGQCPISCICPFLEHLLFQKFAFPLEALFLKEQLTFWVLIFIDKVSFFGKVIFIRELLIKYTKL